MPLRLVDRENTGAVGSIGVTLEANPSNVDGTHTIPQGATGQLVPVLRPFDAAAVGQYSSSAVRTGTIGATLENSTFGNNWVPLNNPTYWVAPTSQGAGDGSTRNDARTWASLPALQPGDVVSFRSDLGPYTDQSITMSNVNGTANDKIILQGESADTHAELRGSSADSLTYGMRFTDCSYIDVAGIDQDGIPTAAGKTRHPYYTIQTPLLIDGDSSYIEIHDFTWQRSNGWAGIRIADTSHHNLIRDFTGGEHGTRDTWTNDDYGTGNGLDSGDYLETFFDTYQNTFLRGNVYAIGHGGTNIEGRYNAVIDCSIDGDFLTDLHPDPWPAGHPIQNARVIADMPGTQKGTRNGSSRADYDWTGGRNLVQGCDLYNARDQQDNQAKGQVWRMAGYRNILRFTKCRDIDCSNGISITASTQTNRQAAQNQVYNNEMTNQTGIEGEVGMFEIRGESATAVGANRVFNNAMDSSFTGTIALIDHRDYTNDPYPYYLTGETPSDVWGNNQYYHNSHANALTDMDVAGVTTVPALWYRPIPDWEGDRPNQIFGNIGGAFKSATGGGAHATITSATGSGTSFVVDTPFAFVYDFDSPHVPNDTLYINGTRTQIVIVNESTRTITVADPVSWTQNDGIYVSDTVDGSGNVTTGIPT